MGDYAHFVSLGMFIIDDFEFLDHYGSKTGKSMKPQIGGGGTYACIGARVWLPPKRVGMVIDRGNDFPSDIQASLDHFGSAMWLYRDNAQRCTTRALNSYRGEQRSFQYTTPRIRITPVDLAGTNLDRPGTLHFICSPSRAKEIVREIVDCPNWNPVTVFEPIPDRCVPEELPSLLEVLPHIHVLSPNAEEALSLLSISDTLSRPVIEYACDRFLSYGVGPEGRGHVIIRSGALGAYVASRYRSGEWIDAFWAGKDTVNVVDVTGAGNSFLGGLCAGLLFTDGDVFEAVFYASVSASFIIEQFGLPRLTNKEGGTDSISEEWNGDTAANRLKQLKARYNRAETVE